MGASSPYLPIIITGGPVSQTPNSPVSMIPVPSYPGIFPGNDAAAHIAAQIVHPVNLPHGARTEDIYKAVKELDDSLKNAATSISDAVQVAADADNMAGQLLSNPEYSSLQGYASQLRTGSLALSQNLSEKSRLENQIKEKQRTVIQKKNEFTRGIGRGFDIDEAEQENKLNIREIAFYFMNGHATGLNKFWNEYLVVPKVELLQTQQQLAAVYNNISVIRNTLMADLSQIEARKVQVRAAAEAAAKAKAEADARAAAEAAAKAKAEADARAAAEAAAKAKAEADARAAAEAAAKAKAVADARAAAEAAAKAKAEADARAAAEAAAKAKAEADARAVAEAAAKVKAEAEAQERQNWASLQSVMDVTPVPVYTADMVQKAESAMVQPGVMALPFLPRMMNLAVAGEGFVPVTPEVNTLIGNTLIRASTALSEWAMAAETAVSAATASVLVATFWSTEAGKGSDKVPGRDMGALFATQSNLLTYGMDNSEGIQPGMDIVELPVRASLVEENGRLALRLLKTGTGGLSATVRILTASRDPEPDWIKLLYLVLVRGITGRF